MKKAEFKMSIRGIAKTRNRFISILAIVALGVGFLAGLIAATPDMVETTDKYINGLNMYELNIKGTLGLTDDDVNRLKSVDQINTVMPAYVRDFLMISDDADSRVVRLYGVLDEGKSLPLNKLELISGRMPQNEHECVLEIPNSYYDEGYKSLKISPETPDYESISDVLNITEFEVVGIVKSPNFISIETEYSTVGTGNLSFAAYTFKSAYSMDVYTDIFASTNITSGINTFDDLYADKLNGLSDMLEPIGGEQSQQRYEQVISDAQKELDSNKQELLDKKKSVYAELSDAYRRISNGKEEISKYESQLAESKKQLQSSAETLLVLKGQLEELNNKVGEYTIIEQQMRPNALALKEMLENGITLTPEQLAFLAKYDALAAFLNAAPENVATLETNIGLLSAGIESGNAQYESAVKQLDEQKASLNDAEADYKSAVATADSEFADADKKIADAEADISAIEVPEWYIFDRMDNVGIKSYDSNAMKVAAIAKVFPVFFFLVAALVALTTMSRLVEEERSQIGTLKSLGFSGFKILRYYLVYSGLAAIIGTTIGLLAGFKVFPTVISNAYRMMFNIPVAETPFRWEIALTVSLITVLSILLTTFFACKSTLHEQPAQLMMAKAPTAGKRILLERVPFFWNHLKFMSKVTARNLFRYKKRFLMTIIGVAGCSALLVTGFGVRDSINSIVDKQFGEVDKYNLTVQIEETTDIYSDSSLMEFLSSDAVGKYIPIHNENADIVLNDKSYAVFLEVPENSVKFNDFISFKTRKTQQPVEFNESSVVITEKLAEVSGIKEGDAIEVRGSDNRNHVLTVTGITEHYVESYLYIGTEAYAKAFHTAPVFNQILINTNKASGMTTETISENALKCSSISYCVFNESIMESFANSVKSIDYIVIVLILSAGLLSMIVIYNLTNVNICERKKELATLKVLGFYSGETSKYIFKETNILSVIGTAFGLIGGIWLHRFVILTVEIDSVMFGRTIKPLSYIFAAAISILFTLGVDLIMKRNIDKIDMVEAMKAND